MIFPKTKKAKIILPAVFIIAVGLVLFLPHIAHAESGVSEFFGRALGWLLYAILSLFARLLVAVIQMLVAVASYNDFTNATAVVKGWVITRDVCNMFFIGVLLMMAFGTILKWETYRYNKMLGRLILMAFLINFSKFICGFFIDIFQVIMLTFVNAFSGVAAGTFASALGIKEMLQMTTSVDKTFEFQDIIGSLFLALLLVTVALIVMIAITIVLLMRIIWLWVLIVLSPVAFLLKTWPGGGEKFASRWWGDFGKNLTGGPMLAFFLWLALTIMTTGSTDTRSLAERELSVSKDAMRVEQTAVIESGGSQPGGDTAQEFYTTISKISSSDMLLSYIISISLLIGALMMGQQMGVAGGSAISWAQGKTGGLLRKAAVLGAAGMAGGVLGAGLAMNAKKNWENVKKMGGGIRGGVRNRMMGWTGLDLRKKEWLEGWTYSGSQHEKEAEAKMRGKAQRRAAKAPLLSAAATPAHLLTEYARLKTFKKIPYLFGSTQAMEQEAQEKENSFSRLNKAVGNVKDRYGKWRPVEDVALEKVIEDRQGEEIKKQAGLIAPEREKNAVWAKEVRSNLDEETNEAEAKKLQTELKKLKYNTIEGEQNISGRPVPYTFTFDQQWESIEKELLAKGKTETEINQEKTKFTEDWDKNKAEHDLRKSGALDRIAIDTRREYEAPEKQDELLAKFKVDTAEEIHKAKEEKEKITKGQLSESQLETRKNDETLLLKELEKIRRELEKKRTEGKPVEMDNELLKKKGKELEQLRDYDTLTAKEKRENKTRERPLDERIEQLEFIQKYAKMSSGEKEGLNKELEDKKNDWIKAQDAYNKVRPAVNYELRRAQRLAINEEKNKITTDSWQELASFIEDAMKHNDLNKVAAAYLKADEYANANEIQNWFGYDSDAKGLKEFIMGELVGKSGGINSRKKAEELGLSWEDYTDEHGNKREGFMNKQGMGMSMEQAMAIGNDASYTGEKVNHWGIARAVVVKNGRQVWQNEDDRLKEVLAEVRKTDFENTMRRFNRLAFGNEYVKDKWDFRTSGGRDFDMSSFGLAFVKENWSKFSDLLGRGRFGNNLAINMGKPQNMRMLLALQPFIPEADQRKFRDTMQRVVYFGGAEDGEFNDFDDINRRKAMGTL